MKQTELYQYQREDVRGIRNREGVALLASEVGLGKSLISLDYAHRFLPTDPPGPVIVVCPAHLKIHWKREAEKHLGLRAEVLYGQNHPPDKRAPRNKNQIYVLNYDILVPPHWKPRTQPPDDSWISWLADLEPRLIIGDEAHLLKGTRTARTRAFRWLRRRIPHCLLLTGTPLANKPADLWPLLNILKPEAFPSQFDFLSRYSIMRKMWWGIHSTGAKNLEELHQVLQPYMIRRRKVDVMAQLPAIIYSVVPIECDLREYRKAETDYIGWLENTSPAMARRAAKSEQLSRLNGLRSLAGRLKVPGVISWVESFFEESDGKLLLGAIHYDVTGPIMDKFRSAATLVDGRVGAVEKQHRFDKFNHDARCRLLVGNIDAAGTGWSCRSASDVGFLEIPWRPSDVTQFIGRIHGLERGIPGTAAHARFFIAPDTVEEDLLKIIQRKDGWAQAAIDGEGGSDFDTLVELQKAIKKRQKVTA